MRWTVASGLTRPCIFHELCKLIGNPVNWRCAAHPTVRTFVSIRPVKKCVPRIWRFFLFTKWWRVYANCMQISCQKSAKNVTNGLSTVWRGRSFTKLFETFEGGNRQMPFIHHKGRNKFDIQMSALIQRHYHRIKGHGNISPFFSFFVLKIKMRGDEAETFHTRLRLLPGRRRWMKEFPASNQRHVADPSTRFFNSIEIQFLLNLFWNFLDIFDWFYVNFMQILCKFGANSSKNVIRSWPINSIKIQF